MQGSLEGAGLCEKFIFEGGRSEEEVDGPLNRILLGPVKKLARGPSDLDCAAHQGLRQQQFLRVLRDEVGCIPDFGVEIVR